MKNIHDYLGLINSNDANALILLFLFTAIIGYLVGRVFYI